MELYDTQKKHVNISQANAKDGAAPWNVLPHKYTSLYKQYVFGSQIIKKYFKSVANSMLIHYMFHQYGSSEVKSYRQKLLIKKLLSKQIDLLNYITRIICTY